MKKIDLSRTVYDLVQEYPELVGIMDGIGFHEITRKAMLHSVGKVMTIPRGAGMKGIPMEKVIMALLENGFTPVGNMPAAADSMQLSPEENELPQKPVQDDRTEQIKGYLKRLNSGEELESVRKDFAAEFVCVDAMEIMKAEQELIAEGMSQNEFRQLCDLHSALFHGRTREEKIANAEKAMAAARKNSTAAAPDSQDKNVRAAALAAIPGHPLHTLSRENRSLEQLLSEAKEQLSDSKGLIAALEKIREVSVHYAKKGDLLYPHLKVKYGITGPSNVMWTADDDIRDDLGALLTDTARDKSWEERVAAVLTRIEEMIYKEASILFPICAITFTEEEWKQIYRDAKDYADCLGIRGDRWEAAEESNAQQSSLAEDEIVMPGGHLTLAQLTALLNTIPLEISFVDAENINRFFNEGPKVFKRPAMALDRDVFSCHPPKIEPMVRAIIEDFRTGKRDSVPVWMEKNGRTMLVTYMAVRDTNRQYLGTVELVQDMEAAKAHFQK